MRAPSEEEYGRVLDEIAAISGDLEEAANDAEPDELKRRLEELCVRLERLRQPLPA